MTANYQDVTPEMIRAVSAYLQETKPSQFYENINAAINKFLGVAADELEQKMAHSVAVEAGV
ncbi:hypothetical protein [Rhodococcoides fascians]|uniref:hypothetical protein n=1 Tax=Rhodococcoides fascians TaxID=1828 RepID=UPI000B0E1D33|nr:hypothetical protein [Rhodococcus fascians]